MVCLFPGRGALQRRPGPTRPRTRAESSRLKSSCSPRRLHHAARLFREAKQAVDLTQAPILVAIGRGIKAPENIPMAENRQAARRRTGRLASHLR